MQDQYHLKSKWFSVLLHLGFVPLFYGAYHFYLERLSGCAGQDVFRVLSTGDFFLIHNRPVHVFSQWLPLLALYAGMSLENILKIFSLSPIIHQYLLALFCLYLLKDPISAIGVLLTQYFGISGLFYTNPNLEIQYCISLGIVFYALLHNKSVSDVLRWSLVFLVTVIITTSYLPTAGFLLFAMVLSLKRVKRQEALLVSVFILISLGLKFFLLDPYVISVLNYDLAKTYPENHFMGVAQFLSYYIDGQGHEVLFVVIMLLFVLFKMRLTHFLLLASTVLLYALLVVQYYGLEFNSHHVGLPLTFFLLVVIVGTVKTSKTASIFFTVLTFVFVLVKADLIVNTFGKEYTVETDNLKKLLVQMDCLSTDYIVYDHPSSEASFGILGLYERSLIYSKVMGLETCKGVMFRDKISDHLSDLGVYYTPEELVMIESMPDDQLLQWLDKKIDELHLESSIFPMRPVGFELISDDELCTN